MTSAHCEEMIENIFVGNQIDPESLKEFLKIVSNQLSEHSHFNSPQVEGNEDMNESPKAKYLNILISQCEESKGPNGDNKIKNILQDIESLKLSIHTLQQQISEVVCAQEMSRKIECTTRQHYQTLIDSLYTESLNSGFCNLRRQYYDVKNLTDDLVLTCNSMKEEITSIQEQILALQKLPVLEKKLILLLEWRASLREEFEVLAERYEHIKTVSISRCEVNDLLTKKVDYAHLSKYVTGNNFQEARKEFAAEFEQIKELFCELQLHLNAKVVSLHKEVQRVLSELATKRRLDKRGNKIRNAMCQ